MKNALVGFLILCLAFIGCQKEPIELPHCDDSKLRKFDMKAYQGEDVNECDFLLARYEFMSKVYYIIDNRCADIAYEPEDCDCVKLREGNPQYDSFFTEAVLVEIVGISK